MYTNAAAEKAFNASRQELYGRTDQDIFPSEVAAQFTKNDQQALSDGKGLQVIETLEQSDGVLHYSLVNKFPIPGPNGEVTLIGGTAFDITERKQAEEALQESEERYRTLFESIDEGFCVLEKVESEIGQPLDFLYMEANPAFANQSGVSGVVGKTVRQVFPGESEEWFEIYNDILKTGVPMKFERKLATQERILEIYAFRVEDGTNRHVAVVFNDITERKQAEEALQSLNLQLETRVVMRTTELQEANAALQESRRRLQILSQRLVEVQEEERRAIARELHDRVGQSLSALNINMIIMRDQLLPDSLERVAPRLSDSMHLVGETITLVRDVMSNLRPSVLDDYGLEAALQSHIDEYMSRYEIKVVLERPPQLLPRLGPSIEMTFLRVAQEALMNIARHANASQVTLSIRQEGDSICMTIQDNGSGIASWQQANRPGSHGLIIMRERAEAVGGSLEVASVPGKGTRVEMSIPLGKASQNEAQKEMLE
jgi:PAS domain S-box-containing protein